MRVQGRRWAVVTAVSGTVFIAAGAFWLSFTALADLAARSGIGSGQAWAWPLIVDGIIVVATVAVVALSGQRSAWYPWALLIGGALVSVTANALHAVVAADADVPGMLAATVAAVPPVVLLAITHLTVILTRISPAMPGIRTDADDDPTDGATIEDTAPRPTADLLSPAAPPAGGTTEQTATTTGVPDPATARETNQGRAERRERAHLLRERDWSNKQIAREVGVHPSTVGRWFAATHLADEPSPGARGAGNSEEES